MKGSGVNGRTGLMMVGFGMIVLLLGCAQTREKKPTVEELFKKSIKNSRVLNDDPAIEAVREYQGSDRSDTGRKTASLSEEWSFVEPFMKVLMPESLFETLFPETSPERFRTKQTAPPGRRSFEGPTVTSTFTQTEVRQAVRSIANQAGVSVMMDQQVNGLVSAVIQDQSFEAALRRLLVPLGYVYRKVDDQYYVGVADPSSSLFSKLSVNRTYRVKHLAPDKLMDILPERHRKFVQTSAQQQIMLIEAPVRITHDIISKLKTADEPVRQVVIEAIVAVFAPDTRFRFGLDFNQGIRVRGNDFINVMMEDLNLSGQYGPPQFSDVRNFSFTSTFLQALAEEGYLSIRAAPRVMARDGEKAKIRIGRQTFFATQPQPDNADFFVRQELEEVQSGIVLNMKPRIRGDRVIIDLQDAEVSEEIRTSQRATALNSQFPVINRRTVSTRVAVEDGKTIVIGGLVQKKVVSQEANVPILGNIPLLGRLFSQSDHQQQSREVAVFLSPKIVRR